MTDMLYNNLYLVSLCHVAITVAVLFWSGELQFTEAGSFYHRWPQQRLHPASESGLTNLSNFTLKIVKELSEPLICATRCNLERQCQAAQLQLSTKICTLFNISTNNTAMVVLVADDDFFTFTAAIVTKAKLVPPPSFHYETLKTFIDKAESCLYYRQLDESIENGYTVLKHSTTLAKPILFSCWLCLLQRRYDLTSVKWINSVYFRIPSAYYWKSMQLEYSTNGTLYTKLQVPYKEKHTVSNTEKGFVLIAWKLERPLLLRYCLVSGIIISRWPAEVGFKFLIGNCTPACKDSPIERYTSVINETKTTNSKPSSLEKNNILFDLLKPTIITGIQIDGCTANNTWVSTYRVQVKVNESHPWNEVVSDSGLSPFEGVTDPFSRSVSFFANGSIAVKFVRVLPLEFYGSTICRNLTILGCQQIPNYLPNLASEERTRLREPYSAIKEHRTKIGNCFHIKKKDKKAGRIMLVLNLLATHTITSMELSPPIILPGTELEKMPQPVDLTFRLSADEPTNVHLGSIEPQCGLMVMGFPTLLQKSNLIVTCSPSVSGQYLLIITENETTDASFCGISAYNDQANNIALSKTVLVSSGIGTAATTVVTDGHLQPDYIETAMEPMWFQVNLGMAFLVSKIVIATHNTGNSPSTDFQPADLKEKPVLTILVGGNDDSISSVCDYFFLDDPSAGLQYIPGSAFIFHCTPPMLGEAVRILKNIHGTIKIAEILVH